MLAVQPNPTLELLRRERARRELLWFTTYTFPGYFVGWHHALLGRVLDEFIAKKITRLIVSMPPRHGKSELVSRRLPAFILGRDPNARVITASYAQRLSRKMSRDVQRIMSGPRFRNLFPAVRLGLKTKASDDALKTQDEFEIPGFEGSYTATSPGGSVTGMGFDYGIIDDPLKGRAEAESEVIREGVASWFDADFFTRQEGDATSDAPILITLTRWHEKDLAGSLLKESLEDKSGEQWTLLTLPAVADEDAIRSKADQRTEIGAPLWPEKYSVERLGRLRRKIGSYNWSALYQQRPTPAEGGIFKRSWFRYYHRMRDGRLDCDGSTFEFDKAGRTTFTVVDLAISKKTEADYTVISDWSLANDGRSLVLLDLERDKFEGPDIIPAIKRHAKCWKSSFVAIESVGFQTYLTEMARHAGVPVREIDPGRNDKVTRAIAATPMFEAGEVWFPSNEIAPHWLPDFEAELLTFPNGAHDDSVDNVSYAVHIATDQSWLGGAPAPLPLPRNTDPGYDLASPFESAPGFESPFQRS